MLKKLTHKLNIRSIISPGDIRSIKPPVSTSLTPRTSIFSQGIPELVIWISDRKVDLQAMFNLHSFKAENANVSPPVKEGIL